MSKFLTGTIKNLENEINDNEKKKKSNKKVYSSKMAKKIKKATEIQAKQLKDSGFSRQFDTIMFDNYNEPTAINQASVINKNGCVSHDLSLQRDIDFKNGYSEFGKTQMHYDVEEHFDMMSSNMTPHTSHREYTITKDHNHTLGLYTGTDPYYKSKTDGFEPVSLFEPMKDLTYVNGAPVKTDELEGRYLASNKNNYGDLPFEADMKVQPGLFGETMAPYTVYRNLPKTIDELRSKTNPKETYKAEKIEAVQKGQYRGAPVHLTKFKKKGFKDTSVDDLLPNSAPANKQAIGLLISCATPFVTSMYASLDAKASINAFFSLISFITLPDGVLFSVHWQSCCIKWLT